MKICPNCGAALNGGGTCPYCTGSLKNAEQADPRLYAPPEPLRDPVTGRIISGNPYEDEERACRSVPTHHVPTHGYRSGTPTEGQSNPFLAQVQTYDREVSPAAITLAILFPGLGALMARNYEDRNEYTSGRIKAVSVISGVIQIALIVFLIVWLVRR